MRRAASWVVLVAGVLLFLSGLAHAFLGLPALRAELSGASVPEDVATSVAIGWLYGSGAMLTFGVLVLAIWWSGRRGDAHASMLLAPVSLFYLIFGTLSFLNTGGEPHFIGFIVLGALLLFGWFGLRKS